MAALPSTAPAAAAVSSAGAGPSPSSPFSSLLPPHYRETVRAYLRDDAPTFDVGGYVVGDAPETAKLLCKTTCVLAGVPFFDAVFAELGCAVSWCAGALEGTVVQAPSVVALVTGPVRMLLLGERTALNILSRASGIASAAKEVVDAARGAGWHGEVAGTRKVTPGFRLVEKYALLVGGASTHRMDLSSMVMLKGEWAVFPSTPVFFFFPKRAALVPPLSAWA
jgi:nicotinate-nucleotide pyrophosphorylase (carboxylating)